MAKKPETIYELNEAQLKAISKLRTVNVKLLTELEEALAHADRWHGEGQSGEGRRCTSCIEFVPTVRTTLEEAKK